MPILGGRNSTKSAFLCLVVSDVSAVGWLWWRGRQRGGRAPPCVTQHLLRSAAPHMVTKDTQWLYCPVHGHFYNTGAHKEWWVTLWREWNCYPQSPIGDPPILFNTSIFISTITMSPSRSQKLNHRKVLIHHWDLHTLSIDHAEISDWMEHFPPIWNAGFPESSIFPLILKTLQIRARFFLGVWKKQR